MWFLPLIKMILVKVPAINGLGKTNGCEKSPWLIIKELEKIGKNIGGIEEIKANNENIEETQINIYNKTKELLDKLNNLDKSKYVFFLGGDHSVSFPLVKAFSLVNKDAGLIVLDAHADCMPTMKEPTHEEWLRALVESGFDPNNILLVGLRKVEPQEISFLKEKGINCFWMKKFVSNFKETIDLITEKVRKFPSLYLSIDIDVVDQAFAPGTGYAEPGGFSSKEFLYLVQRLFLLKNLKAVDLVEINPEKDINNQTVKLGTRIIEELKNEMFYRN